jgi:NAD-dependent deacetylase
MEWREDLNLGAMCVKGYQLRPHIVWFGEQVPLLPKASELTSRADILLIIGTSMQVYPAAGLVHYAPDNTPIYFIDPKPAIEASAFPNLNILADTAAAGVPRLVRHLISAVSSG